MKLVQSIMTKNPCYTAGKKIKVKGLMLHSVGCSQPNASVFINGWNKPSYTRACVHGFIDANTGTIYQTLPWNHRGWHCGGSGNNTHIGVEMCEPSCIKYTGGSTFTITDKEVARACVKRTYDASVELFAMLCKEYNLNPLTDICSHKEGYTKGIASNHGDPEHLWKGVGLNYTMNTFRKDVKVKMGGSSTISSTDSSTQTTSYTLKQFIKDVQRVTGSKVDGIAGSETLGNTPTISSIKNRKHAVVKYVQKRLISLGYSVGSCGADGIFGSATTSAVKAYQQKTGCVADGEITAKNKTWKKLLGIE